MSEINTRKGAVMPVCSECGSADVLFDAFAEWDTFRQDYVLRSSFDHTECCNCDGECSVDWIECREYTSRAT